MEESKIMSLVNDYIKDNQVPTELVYFVSLAFIDGWKAALQVSVVEYKTAYEWFDTYPCPMLKTKMYIYSTGLAASTKYKDLAAAICAEIEWIKTREGANFWFELFKKVKQHILPKYEELQHLDKSKEQTT